MHQRPPGPGPDARPGSKSVAPPCCVASRVCGVWPCGIIVPCGLRLAVDKTAGRWKTTSCVLPAAHYRRIGWDGDMGALRRRFPPLNADERVGLLAGCSRKPDCPRQVWRKRIQTKETLCCSRGTASGPALAALHAPALFQTIVVAWRRCSAHGIIFCSRSATDRLHTSQAV